VDSFEPSFGSVLLRVYESSDPGSSIVVLTPTAALAMARAVAAAVTVLAARSR
jgi:hypothetical protein